MPALYYSNFGKSLDNLVKVIVCLDFKNSFKEIQFRFLFVSFPYEAKHVISQRRHSFPLVSFHFLFTFNYYQKHFYKGHVWLSVYTQITFENFFENIEKENCTFVRSSPRNPHFFEIVEIFKEMPRLKRSRNFVLENFRFLTIMLDLKPIISFPFVSFHF